MVTCAELLAGWMRLGIRPADVVMVHGSLSSFGNVDGGARAVIDSLREAVGQEGTLVMPSFTPQISDPFDDVRLTTDRERERARTAVPEFEPETPSRMGAIAEELRASKGTVRSGHPQVSVVANGPQADQIVTPLPLGFAVGPESPFGVVRNLRGKILLLGVGYNRNTFLHHAESLCVNRRLKLRRFPWRVNGERVWIETTDVADDLDTLFPVIGREYDASAAPSYGLVGEAPCRLMDADHFVAFARERLDHYLDARPMDQLPDGPPAG